MLKDKTKVTAAQVQAELDELESTYKRRRKTLRALLAVLRTEEPAPPESEAKPDA
jgi:hypothetical protein